MEPIYLLYDERMLEHRPIGWVEPDVFPETREECDDDYPLENPERIRVIFERLTRLEYRLAMEGYANNIIPSYDSPAAQPFFFFKRLSCKLATKDQILLAHSQAQYDHLARLEEYTDSELAAMSQKASTEVYYCRETFQAARLAAGGLLSCVDAVCDGSNTSSTTPNKAVALVRPPGHHACQSQEMGFCFIDSVVVAAKYALTSNKKNKQKQVVKKVAILDWDIHDGNGTAELTRHDENIFRIDIHRFNRKEGFYPYTGAPDDIGGKAPATRGLNLNMAWSRGGMGNTEYAAAFYELILPLLADYQPDLLLISCGLDAAMGDLLGGCYLTPGFFHAMTRATLEVVGPNCPVVCALEGGYTMSVIPDCMEAVTLAMLNLPFKCHTTQQLESFLGGGAAEASRSPLWSSSSSWSKNNNINNDPLQRSRRVLSHYYVRTNNDNVNNVSRSKTSVIIPSAVNDINTSIRIFKGIDRWHHVTLERIKPRPQKRSKKAKKKKPTMSKNQKKKHPHKKKSLNKKCRRRRRRQSSFDDSLSSLSSSSSFSSDEDDDNDKLLVCEEEEEEEHRPPLQRPRVYLWYGTELHHHRHQYHHRDRGERPHTARRDDLQSMAA